MDLNKHKKRIKYYLRQNKQGGTLILALVFLTILTVIAVALSELVMIQNRLAQMKIAEEYGFQIAEAGLNYARWRLAHNPADVSSETKVLNDPEGGSVGSFQITVTPPPPQGGTTEIISAGWYQNKFDLRRIVSARYGKEAFTFYAFLFDSPVWFGGPTVDGRTHSNDGIRMDSTANSKVTSAKETYTCTYIHGCSSPTTRPGIWGTGGNQNLWEFPVSNIDFNQVTTDLATLKTIAQNGGGLYLAQQGQGYDLNFLANGTVEVYRVQQLDDHVTHYRWEEGQWKKITSSLDIKNEELQQTYTLQNNDLIFVSDNVWIRGQVARRVTVASAKLPEVPNNTTDVMISNNLIYNDYNGNSVLGIIGQKNILLTLKVPNNLRIDAVLMAQKGLITRDYYPANSKTVPYNIRNSITTYGSMISKDFSDPEFRWVNGSGQTVGGFQYNYNSYDPQLVYNPPPYFPVHGDYKFISWEEKEKIP